MMMTSVTGRHHHSLLSHRLTSDKMKRPSSLAAPEDENELLDESAQEQIVQTFEKNAEQLQNRTKLLKCVQQYSAPLPVQCALCALCNAHVTLNASSPLFAVARCVPFRSLAASCACSKASIRALNSNSIHSCAMVWAALAY